MAKKKEEPKEDFSVFDEEPSFQAFDSEDDFSIFDGNEDPESMKVPFLPESSWQRGLLESQPIQAAGRAALRGAEWAGNKLDQYTGAPTRATVGALQDDVTSPLKALRAGAEQMSKDPGTAPTYKEITEKAGLKPPYSTGAGLYLDMFAPSGTGVVTQGLAKGTGLLAKNSGKIGSGLRAAGEFVGDKTGQLTSRVGSQLTGVPEKTIQTFIDKPEKIKELFKKYKGDYTTAADDIREAYMAAVQRKKSSLNKTITDELKAIPEQRIMDPKEIVELINSKKAEYKKLARPESVSAMDSLLGKISAFLPKKQIVEPTEALTDGISGIERFAREVPPTVKMVPDFDAKITPQQMQELKSYFQDIATPAYQKGGQIFTLGKDAANVSKQAAANARQQMLGISDEIADANSELAKLHRIESKINRNMLNSEVADGALYAAGGGSNPRGAKNLEKLGTIVGKDFLTPAEELAAARQFDKAPFLPVDTTGKSMTRMAAAGAVGGVLGGGPLTAIATSSMTSPQVLKRAIQAGQITSDTVKKFMGTAGPLTEETLEVAAALLGTAEGQKRFNLILNAGRGANAELQE